MLFDPFTPNPPFLFPLEKLHTSCAHFNPLSANPTKLSNTLKQCVGNLPMNCLTVFDHFVGLELKRLMYTKKLDKKMNVDFSRNNSLQMNVKIITLNSIN